MAKENLVFLVLLISVLTFTIISAEEFGYNFLVEPATVTNLSNSTVNNTDFCGGILCTNYLLRSGGSGSPMTGSIHFANGGLGLVVGAVTKNFNAIMDTDEDYFIDGSWEHRIGSQVFWSSGSNNIFQTGSNNTYASGSDAIFESGSDAIFQSGGDAIFQSGSRLIMDPSSDLRFGGSSGTFIRSVGAEVSLIEIASGYTERSSIFLFPIRNYTINGNTFNPGQFALVDFTIRSVNNNILNVDSSADKLTLDGDIDLLDDLHYSVDNIGAFYGASDDYQLKYNTTGVFDKLLVGSLPREFQGFSEYRFDNDINVDRNDLIFGVGSSIVDSVGSRTVLEFTSVDREFAINSRWSFRNDLLLNTGGHLKVQSTGDTTWDSGSTFTFNAAIMEIAVDTFLRQGGVFGHTYQFASNNFISFQLTGDFKNTVGFVGQTVFTHNSSGIIFNPLSDNVSNVIMKGDTVIYFNATALGDKLTLNGDIDFLDDLHFAVDNIGIFQGASDDYQLKYNTTGVFDKLLVGSLPREFQGFSEYRFDANVSLKGFNLTNVDTIEVTNLNATTYHLANGGNITSNSSCLTLTSPDGTTTSDICNVGF